MNPAVISNWDPERAVGEFLRDLEARNYTPCTVTTRRESLRKFLRFLDGTDVDRLQDVTLELLEEYRHRLSAAKYSPCTIDWSLRGVRLFFAWLTERGALFESPARELHIQKPVLRLGRVLTEKQVQSLLRAPDLSTPAGLRDRALLEVLYATGVRRAELVGLSVTGLDLDQQTMRVMGKGRKERVLPLGRHATEYLRRYVEQARPTFAPADDPSCDALWLTRFRRPMVPTSVNCLVARHAAAAGIPGSVGPHTLRRTCATHLLRNGAHPSSVAQLLGHSSLRSLSHYLKTTITDLMATHARTRPGR